MSSFVDLFAQTSGADDPCAISCGSPIAKKYMGWIQETRMYRLIHWIRKFLPYRARISIAIRPSMKRKTEVCVVRQAVCSDVRSAWCTGSLPAHVRSDDLSISRSFAVRSSIVALARSLFRCSESDNSRYVLCSCTTFSFLCPSVHEGTDLHAFSDIEESDPFWSVQLVSAGAQHINVTFVYIDRDLPECLHGVCVEQDSVFM